MLIIRQKSSHNLAGCVLKINRQEIDRSCLFIYLLSWCGKTKSYLNLSVSPFKVMPNGPKRKLSINMRDIIPLS